MRQGSAEESTKARRVAEAKEAAEDIMETDSADETSTNEHLRGMTPSIDDEGIFGERTNPTFDVDEEVSVVGSPEKKKKKKDKSRRLQKREAGSTSGVDSVLKAGKYLTGATEEKKKQDAEAKVRAATA
jgi:hypothetical protein